MDIIRNQLPISYTLAIGWLDKSRGHGLWNLVNKESPAWNFIHGSTWQVPDGDEEKENKKWEPKIPVVLGQIPNQYQGKDEKKV
jgi:hypothetical protein